MEAVPILIIIGAPVLTSMGFKFAFVENILVRLLMVGALIYAVRFSNADPLFSLLVLLAIITLLIERNHVVVAGLPDQSPVKIGPTNLYPMKAADNILSHITVDSSYDAHESNHEADVHISDERADIKEGPSNHDSPSFYKSLGLV